MTRLRTALELAGFAARLLAAAWPARRQETAAGH
jgi:hypothetical protein